MPPELAAGTYVFQGSAGYDGQFYREAAHDPFLSKGYWKKMDSPQLRCRRLLVPLAAWAVGLGRRYWIDGSYIAVELAFAGLGVYWCARLLARRRKPPAWGLLFVVVPASLASFDRMLVDGPLTALFAGFLLYCEEEKWARVWTTAMLAALTRETGLFLAAGLVLDQLLRKEWRRAVWFASSSLPALGWYAYLGNVLPQDGPVSILGVPAWGLLRRLFWLRPVSQIDPRAQVLLLTTDFLAMLGLIVSIVWAAIWLLKTPRGPVTLCLALFIALALLVDGPSYLTEAFGFARPVSPMLLWLMLEGVSRKVWIALAPPLLVSLAVSVVFISPVWTVIKAVVR